jgi:hypothetical protein
MSDETNEDVGRWRLIEENPEPPPLPEIQFIELWGGRMMLLTWGSWYNGYKPSWHSKTDRYEGYFEKIRRRTHTIRVLGKYVQVPSYTHWRYVVPPAYYNPYDLHACNTPTPENCT